MSLPGYAVVVGAAGCIGREVAYQLVERGIAGLLCADLNEPGAEEVQKQCEIIAKGRKFCAISCPVQVTDKRSIESTLEKAVQEFGRIDYWVNAFGLGTRSHNLIGDVDISECDLLYSVNQRGLILCTGLAAKAIAGQTARRTEGRSGSREIGKGSIVNVLSLASSVAYPKMVQYASSKAAALSITRTAAMEYAPQGVRVNGVEPGAVETPMMREKFQRSPELKEVMIKAVPGLKRLALPEEVAGVICFLCSSDTSFVNGASFSIDAGVGLHFN